MVEGRRPVGGKGSGDAGSGLSAGISMSLERRPYVTDVGGTRAPPIRPFDLRQEPGAGKPHAGICAGDRGNPVPYRDCNLNADG